MIRIVVAEDEAIIRLDLLEALKELGYDVVGAAHRGDEALELIRKQRPDLAILDVKMPGMDGLAVASELAKERICAVIILTAFSQRSLIEAARDAGALAYLVKPFQPSDLVPTIEIATARFSEANALADELLAVADQADILGRQLELRKLLDRAKGVLMDRFDMTEPQAFGFIQRHAMDHRKKMSDVAQMVIVGELSPVS